jgi:hypothetical protein
LTRIFDGDTLAADSGDRAHRTATPYPETISTHATSELAIAGHAARRVTFTDLDADHHSTDGSYDKCRCERRPPSTIARFLSM